MARFTLSEAFGACEHPNAVRDGDTWVVVRSADRVPVEGHPGREAALRGAAWRNGRGFGVFVAEPLRRQAATSH